MRQHKHKLLTALLFTITLTTAPHIHAETEAPLPHTKLSAHTDHWLKELSDDIPLSKINLPGTHDSGTFTLADPFKGLVAKTQLLNYEHQLHSGIRLFDIRGRVSSDTSISIHHDLVYLHHHLGKFLEDTQKFLQTHPEETVVVSIKKDYHDAEGVTKSFKDVFNDTYYTNPRYADLFYTGDSGNPTLKEARGKIVLLNRLGGGNIKAGYGGDGAGIHWKDNATFTTTIKGNVELHVQDHYKDYYNDKITAVKALLEKANQDTRDNSLYINFLNVSSGGTIFNDALYYAGLINPETSRTIHDNTYTRTGWIMMDYAGNQTGRDALVQNVIDSNRR